MTHKDALLRAWAWVQQCEAGRKQPMPECCGELELVGADIFNEDVPTQYFQCLACGKYVSAIAGEPHEWNAELSDQAAREAGFRVSPAAR